MKFLAKYGLLIFVFNTVLLSITQFRPFANNIFIMIMVCFSIFLMINNRLIINVIKSKSLRFLNIIMVLNFIYYFFFNELNDVDSLKYLLARTIQLLIINISIYLNFDFYHSVFPKYLAYFVCFLVVLGLIINPYIISSRYIGIFWNENAFASFVNIAFAFFFLREGKKTFFSIITILILFVVSVSTGSRSVIVSLILCMLIGNGFSLRNYLYSFFVFFVYFIISNNQTTNSFNRLASLDLFGDRILQIKYAFLTFLNKPFFGYGIDKYSFIDMNLVPSYLFDNIISAHNGYLAILVQFGIFFGGYIIFLIFKHSIVNLKREFSNNNPQNFYSFIIIYCLVISLFESLFTGINEFNTILFLLSLTLLNFKYDKISNIKK